MDYKRMPIEIESPEQMGYSNIKYNLTESSVSDTVLDNVKFDLSKLILSYGNHIGEPKLRDLIARESTGLTQDHIIITAGAAAALFIVATSLLEKEDHLIVIRPNYASNIETPRAIGCAISYCDLIFENQFRISIPGIRRQMQANTKLISVTHPHNPTGTVLTLNEITELAQLADECNCHVLVDETYRELTLNAKHPLAASLHNRLISVSSLSKAYGLPGLRIGWLITKDAVLFEKFLAAKEQIFVCNSVIDEEIACQYLMKRDEYFQPIKKHIAVNRNILINWMQSETRMEMAEPTGGVVCFPRIKNIKENQISEFYKILNLKYGTYVGPGHWFEMPGNYMRIGYGWPGSEELEEGLNNISRTLNDLEVSF